MRLSPFVGVVGRLNSFDVPEHPQPNANAADTEEPSPTNDTDQASHGIAEPLPKSPAVRVAKMDRARLCSDFRRIAEVHNGRVSECMKTGMV